MKKPVIITIAILVIAIITVGTIVIINNNNQNSLEPIQIKKAKDLSALISKIYDGQTKNMIPPTVETQVVDVSDEQAVQYLTGIDNAKDIEFAVVSEPTISSQAYSLILLKVKDGVNADEIAKKMSENIDTRKWICVSAEKLYATSSGNIVFLVMTDEETAKAVYERFKTVVGTVGKEYEKTEIEDELPPEMLVME